MQLEFCQVVAQTEGFCEISCRSMLWNDFSTDGHHVYDPYGKENQAQLAELEHTERFKPRGLGH